MDLIAKARRLESRIATTFDQAARRLVRPAPAEPLEIVHAILDAVEQEVQPTGHGVRVFPFNRIDVSVVAETPQAQGRLKAVLGGVPPLERRIVERLRDGGCDAAGIVVTVRYVERAEDQWPNRQYHLDFTRVEPPVEEPRGDAPPPRVDVAVMKGIAARQTYTFASPRIDVGRCQEVRDSRNRLIRTNHVAFTEGADAANQTVSRQHAHITCDPRTGHVRIHDDGSSHGTGIVRDGRTVSVGRGTRGTRLRSGDEIVVGEARLRIRIP